MRDWVIALGIASTMAANLAAESIIAIDEDFEFRPDAGEEILAGESIASDSGWLLMEGDAIISLEDS